MDFSFENSKRKLSQLFSRSLCISGLSSFVTNLARNRTLVLEYMYSSLTSNTLKHYLGGSSAEGTETSTSDVDSMMVVPDIYVKSSLADTREIKGHVFLLDTYKSRPGYARLKLLQLHDTDYQLFDAYNTTIHEMLEKTDKGSYLSSEKFGNFFVSVPGRIGLSNHHFRHGPCATAEHKDVHGYMSSKPGVTVEKDLAHALACTSWPEETREWLTRKRLHGWPSSDRIETISKQTCFVVPIGDTSSTHFALEWRISFILSERELVWSFNDTHLHCYFILKIILKTCLDPLAPDQISSYNLKTIIFWLSEENGPSIWRHENLVACLEVCLDRLSSCVEERRLNHYFNREANLLGHKFKDKKQKELVMQKIKEIKADIVFFAVECLPTEWNWLELWKQCQGDQLRLIELSFGQMNDLNDNYTTVLKQNTVLKLYRTMFNILLQLVTQNYRPDSLLRQLSALQNEPPDDVECLITEMTMLLLDLRLGMAYMRQITFRDNEAFQRYIDRLSLSTENALELISNAVPIDAMSGTLYLATAHQCVGDFQKSIELVTSLLQQDKHLVYTGWCSKYIGIRFNRGAITKPESHITLQGTEGRTYAAYDVIFSYDNVPYVAYPVKFECALAEFDVNNDNFIVIHPCVHAYFLLCYGYFTLKNYPAYEEALNCLQMVVDETRGGVERHHSLNILGYCYMLIGEFEKGFRCYEESLQETVKLTGESNAAAYHIAIMLLQYLEEQKKKQNMDVNAE